MLLTFPKGCLIFPQCIPFSAGEHLIGDAAEEGFLIRHDFGVSLKLLLKRTTISSRWTQFTEAVVEDEAAVEVEAEEPLVEDVEVSPAQPMQDSTELVTTAKSQGIASPSVAKG